MKYHDGSFIKPKKEAPFGNVNAVKAIIPMSVIQITGSDGRLWMSGIFLVRKNAESIPVSTWTLETILSEIKRCTAVEGMDH